MAQLANRTWVILAAALFALTVLVRAPASWLLGALPKSIECRLPNGSMWHGSCGQLAIAGAALSDVRWQLHPWALFGAHLELAVQSADVRAPATGTLVVGFGGHLAVRDLRADLRNRFGLPAAVSQRLERSSATRACQCGIQERPPGRNPWHRYRTLAGADPSGHALRQLRAALCGRARVAMAPLPGSCATWAARWRYPVR